MSDSNIYHINCSVCGRAWWSEDGFAKMCPECQSAFDSIKTGPQVRDGFISMELEGGGIININAQYITTYAYLKEDDRTAITILLEAMPLYFPGDQTHKLIKE